MNYRDAESSFWGHQPVQWTELWVIPKSKLFNKDLTKMMRGWSISFQAHPDVRHLDRLSRSKWDEVLQLRLKDSQMSWVCYPPSTPPSLLASWSFMVLSCYLHVPERGSNKVHTCEWSNKCGTMVSSQKIPLAQGLQNCCHKIFFQDLISHQSKIKPFLKE